MITSPTYLLYASCIPVSGAKHKIICDLQRNGYVRIPDGLYEILTKHRGKSQDAIKAAYDNRYDQTIDGYFKMLVKHEFAFACNNPERFPPLDLAWKAPFPVFNAILDRDRESTYDLRSAIRQLSGIQCKFLQIRFFDEVGAKDLGELLRYFEEIRSPTIGIEILSPASSVLSVEDARRLLTVHARLNKITLHNSPDPFNIEEVGRKRYLISMPTRVNSESHCGVIDPDLFSINIKAFTEAKRFNSCLNGKVSVDRKGYIRNCPSMPVAFGHINKVSLTEVTNDPVFRAKWTITKDDIKICRDCEFRYICTDCRAYTQDGEADGKPLKCGYDPYSGKWSPVTSAGSSTADVRKQKIAISTTA